MRKLITFFLLLMLVVNVIYVISGAIHYSLRSVDVYSIWLFKAKIFYYEGGIPVETFNNYLYSHPYYPILLPYIFSRFYHLLGGINEIYIYLLYPIIYSFILLINYNNIRRVKVGKIKTLVFIYIFSMFGPLLGQAGRNHAGSADIILLLINSLVVSLALGVKRNQYNVYVMALLIAFASQIKFEGVLYSSILLFLPVGRLKRINSLIIAIAPSILWTLWRNSLGLLADATYTIPGTSEFFREGFTVIMHIIKELLNFRNWYLFWPIFWVVMFIEKSNLKIVKKTFIPALYVIGVCIVGIYLTSSLRLPEHVVSSFDRLLIQMSPFFFIIFAHKINLFFKNMNMIKLERK